ncbi:MAG: YceD family protein [Propionibacteriaceae bacterium]|nr:YceD family protein [Propionibacteriaceae bacterium]
MSRHDFQVSLADLPRTQGACTRFRIDAGFDEAIETGLVCLPARRLVAVDGTLESVGDGVLASAVARATLDAQCSRCLAPFTLDAEVDIQELFVYPEHQGEYEADEVTPIHNDTVDLADAVRDALILDQPLIAVCDPDCPGLCPVCGVDLNADPDHTHGDAVDSRWLTLSQWGKMS